MNELIKKLKDLAGHGVSSQQYNTKTVKLIKIVFLKNFAQFQLKNFYKTILLVSINKKNLLVNSK